MRLAVDAMGSDRFPEPDVEGSVLAAREYGVEILLVGDENAVRPLLTQHHAEGLPIRLVHAPEMLTMDDKGLALALKAKRKEAKTSMALGIDLVKSGEAEAFVTAGNTGAAAATAYFRLGTLPGVERPALAPAFPTRHGSCVVLDVGANPDCKPENLVQFAILGACYAERVRGVPKPRVALLSNAEEAGKGSALVREANALLPATGLNFIGNVEPKELFRGQADVVVCDGFTGNILLKTSEAVAQLILELMKERIQLASLAAKLGALLIRGPLRGLRAMLDPSEVGAAVLLGVDGLVLIGHGRSDAKAIKNAIGQAKQAVESNVLAAMREAIARRMTSHGPAEQERTPA